MDVLNKHKGKAESTECTIAGLYDLNETIGKGHFAVVKLAKHVFTGEKVAVKVIDKTKLDPISKDHLFQEVRCMKLVQHPHIVRLYEVIDTQTKLYLILELGDGDMYDFITDNHDRGLDINTAKKYFTQILEAISYCHDLHVVHRDLKPENVIFFESLGLVKLTDFGFSNLFDPDTKLETSCGSLAYSAPEILLGDSYDAPAVDVWSLGVLLYMLVCGSPPFQEANDSETLTMIMDCKYRIPPHIPADCANLISSMLRKEPKERVSLRDITSHPWLKSDDGCCCADLSCVALVRKEHLSPQDHDGIVQVMVDGGLGSRLEIQRALDADEYSNVTATYYLLAERKLKKQHTEQFKTAVASARGRPASAPRPPRLEHSLSSPEGKSVDTSDILVLEPSPKSAPYTITGNVFNNEDPFSQVRTDNSLSVPIENQRKFSLISEEDEEDEDDGENLTNRILSVRDAKSATWSYKSQNISLHSGVVNTASYPSTTTTTPPNDFEQSLSNMSLRQTQSSRSQQNSQSRPLRSVASSPQLLPLQQIHEESEITSDEDALSTHSQTSLVKFRHSSLSMASPEVARRILSKQKSIQARPCSGSDTSDNDEDKIKENTTRCKTLGVPHKRKDSGGNSSDNDGPSACGGGGGSNGAGVGGNSATNSSHGSQYANHSNGSRSSSRDSPSAKKKYNGASRTLMNEHIARQDNSSSSGTTSVCGSTNSTISANPINLGKGNQRSNSSDSKRGNGSNNNNKDDNSLRILASKLVDSSIARLSNFSLASQTSSLSSRSSAKFSEKNCATHSSQYNRPKDCSSTKFSKARLMNNFKLDFSEISDKELTDSDCGSVQGSIRLKRPVVYAAGSGSNKEYGVITEEQVFPHGSNQKKTTNCCTIM